MAKILIPQGIVLLSTNLTASSYALWNSATAYGVGAKVSSNGDSKGEFEAVAAHTNKDPEDSANLYNAETNPSGVWKFLSTQNRWAWGDQYFNTQSYRDANITLSIAAYGSHALYLGNLDCIDVTITVKDNDTQEVIEPPLTIGVITEPTTHEEYGFGDWIDETVGDVVYQRTTLTRNITYEIVINAGSGTAKLGVLVSGVTRDVGSAVWGAELSSLFYGTVVTDSASGVTFLSKGHSAKTLSPRLEADTSVMRSHFRTFERIQGEPVVFIDDFALLNTYGYLQKFKQSALNPSRFATDVDFVGLI